MDGLEDRVKQCSDENTTLQKRIRLLETENKSLVSQLKRLQNLLTGQGNSSSAAAAAAAAAASAASASSATTSSAAQPATCLMVLMLSFALFLLPNLRPDASKGLANRHSPEMAQAMMKMPPFGGRSRALLQDTLALDSDSEMSEIELDMVLGSEVVVGDEEEDGGIMYVPMPIDSMQISTGKSDSFKTGLWGQKFGKQYPANAKRNGPAFLAEHDYHSTDPSAKRTRFKETSEESLSEILAAAVPSTPVFSGTIKEQLNQSKLYEELAELADLTHGQNIVVRISSEEL